MALRLRLRPEKWRWISSFVIGYWVTSPKIRTPIQDSTGLHQTFKFPLMQPNLITAEAQSLSDVHEMIGLTLTSSIVKDWLI
jgi:hypothetical protein